ncbi:glucosamine-6-phosphate deaminase [Aerococcaceae bacterium DSM 111020]|nr:glucosamine-6-phosphate deaminase [Aerococcaceae bacterium DSM 111020]
MDVRIFDTKEQAAQDAFKVIEKAKKDGAKTFGLATGSTPEPLYDVIRESDLDFTDSVALNLDEYAGLDSSDPQSYAYFMKKNLFDAKPFKETHIPNGLAEDSDAETKRYDEIIANNPIDVQVLGIGPNGHIGFNEPGTSFDVTTRLVDLTPETIDANKRFFDSEEEVPRQAFSMGIKTILQSDLIILLAFGANKAKAVKGMIEGPVTEEVPASVLQQHDNVIVYLDADAASQLEK